MRRSTYDLSLEESMATRLVESRSSWPIQPPPGEYAIAALDRAKQILARDWLTAVLRERSSTLIQAAEDESP